MTMAGQLLGNQFQNGMVTNGEYGISQNMSEGQQHFRSNWYLSRKEIEDNSPSRKDGIDLKKETQLRKLYCSFIQDVGVKLKVPQETIATAMMLCHRFFLRQSHAKNEWQTIATASMFLAGKVEDTPRLLMGVVAVAYETMYRRDPVAPQRIKQKEVYEKQKELILSGERLLLCTIGFDVNIQHPYKPLIAASKKLKIAQNVWKLAWSYVNDWLRTALCLQYKPHYIAAGSMFLAAKFCKMKLPSEKGMIWWQEFDVTPQQLEEVIQQMIKLLDQNRRVEVPYAYDKARQTPMVPEKAPSTSPHSSVLSGSVVTCESSHVHDKEIGVVTSANSVDFELPSSHVVDYDDIHFASKGEIQCRVHDREIDVILSGNSVNPDLPSSHVLVYDDIQLASKGEVQCHVSDCGSARSVVEDGDTFNEVIHDQEMPLEFDQMVGSEIISVHTGLCEMDKHRIRAKLKRRRWERAANKMAVATCNADDDDAWIERELESGIEVKAEPLEKKLRWWVN